jgi:ABC-type multidrug transport system fused ATPase/permease subunit
VIDDEDISRMGLADLRRNLSIIPQNPTLFTGKFACLFVCCCSICYSQLITTGLYSSSRCNAIGTIKYNIDPFGEYSDNEIWNALDATHLSNQIRQMEGQLEAKVTENGNNLSVGTKQVCLSVSSAFVCD